MPFPPAPSKFQFLPTPSARRATQRYPNWLCVQGISTHALREEGDSRGCRAGGCRSISTHALREEGDVRPLGRKRFGEISTHALREEGDKAALPSSFLTINFYPRPPRGGRRTESKSRPGTS